MAKAVQFGLVALLVSTGALYFVISNVYGGDRQAMLEGFHVLSDRLGPSAMPVFVLVHTFAIALCFPYAIVFEAAASFLFGFLNGVICVFAAKVMGAALAFSLGRALFRNSDWASNFVKKNKYFNIISKGVARDGWKFVLLARFSPVPSYVINYGLAATDVNFFVDYLLPTLAGGLPMILQNTSIGSLTSAATHVGAEASSSESSIMTYVLPTIGIFSSVMISWRIKKYTSSQDFGPGDISPVTTIEKNGEKDKGRTRSMHFQLTCPHPPKPGVVYNSPTPSACRRFFMSNSTPAYSRFSSLEQRAASLRLNRSTISNRCLLVDFQNGAGHQRGGASRLNTFGGKGREGEQLLDWEKSLNGRHFGDGNNLQKRSARCASN